MKKRPDIRESLREMALEEIEKKLTAVKKEAALLEKDQASLLRKTQFQCLYCKHKTMLGSWTFERGMVCPADPDADSWPADVGHSYLICSKCKRTISIEFWSERKKLLAIIDKVRTLKTLFAHVQ